jgi:hypothetical protein
MLPPMRPSVITGSRPFMTKPGMMVWNGRLRGPTWFGWPGESTKPEPRFCRLMPPGTTTPEPKPLKFDWIIDTIMPLASAAARYTVPPEGGVPWPKSCARFMSISFARDLRYEASSICAGFTSMNFGSAT